MAAGAAEGGESIVIVSGEATPSTALSPTPTPSADAGLLGAPSGAETNANAAVRARGNAPGGSADASSAPNSAGVSSRGAHSAVDEEDAGTGAPALTYSALFLRFLSFGARAFGGPVVQIAMMREALVTQERWISLPRFNRVLAV
jgi:hypothetical protein